jgi:hypothetical protein
MQRLVVHHWGCHLNNEGLCPQEVASVESARDRAACQPDRKGAGTTSAGESAAQLDP